MPAIPSIQIGDAPAISLNTPEPQYPSQTYAPYPQPLAPQANQSMQQPSLPHLQNVKAQDQQRAMSIEMMDVGGLSLTSPEPVYGFKPELAAAAAAANAAELTAGGSTPSPQPQERQFSAEEVRLKDKLVEAQAQVNHTMWFWPVCVASHQADVCLCAVPIRPLKLKKPCNMLLSKPELQASTPQPRRQLSRRSKSQLAGRQKQRRLTLLPRRLHERPPGDMLWRTF